MCKRISKFLYTWVHIFVYFCDHTHTDIKCIENWIKMFYLHVCVWKTERETTGVESDTDTSHLWNKLFIKNKKKSLLWLLVSQHIQWNLVLLVWLTCALPCEGPGSLDSVIKKRETAVLEMWLDTTAAFLNWACRQGGTIQLTALVFSGGGRAGGASLEPHQSFLHNQPLSLSSFYFQFGLVHRAMPCGVEPLPPVWERSGKLQEKTGFDLQCFIYVDFLVFSFAAYSLHHET